MHILVYLFLIFAPLATNAYELNYDTLYANPKSKKSEVIIFYNSLNECQNCFKAIQKIISILKSNYQNQITAFLIDLKYHPELITDFNLKGPLNLTVIRINDGASFGYSTLTGLEAKLNDPLSFKNQITEFIDNFLSLK